MRSSKETYSNVLLFGIDCEVASGNFLPIIDPIEAREVRVSCDNPFRKNIVTCKDDFRHEFLEEVGGLEFSVKLSSPDFSLPSYIPVLDRASAQFEIPYHIFPVVGFTLGDLVTRGLRRFAGALHEPKEIQFNPFILNSIGFKNKKSILFLSGPDTLIEGVWYRRNERQFFSSLRQIGFSAVTGFNFSVIRGECAFAQVLNQKRSLFSAHLLEKNGIPAIPHVYAINPSQIKRWVDWFKGNPNVRLFAMNCQLQKSDYDYGQTTMAVNQILSSSACLEVILQGFELTRIHEFGANLQRIHFADSVSAKYAQSHIKIFEDPNKNKWVYQRTRLENVPQIMMHNLITRLQYIERVKAQLLKER